MTKQELRKHIKGLINLMSDIEQEIASTNICKQIINTPEWKKAKIVFLYASLPDEVDLSLLLQSAEQCGKKVVLPVVDGNNLQLRFYDPQYFVSKGKYNIKEPTINCPVLDNLDDIDLAIIPGRAFTLDGLRLGRGKGFYDRTLNSLRCPKWGVAFACQIVDNIPIDPWDVRLDRVIIELEI